MFRKVFAIAAASRFKNLAHQRVTIRFRSSLLMVIDGGRHHSLTLCSNELLYNLITPHPS